MTIVSSAGTCHRSLQVLTDIVYVPLPHAQCGKLDGRILISAQARILRAHSRPGREYVLRNPKLIPH